MLNKLNGGITYRFTHAIFILSWGRRPLGMRVRFRVWFSWVLAVH